jgi:hypothetical protein
MPLTIARFVTADHIDIRACISVCSTSTRNVPLDALRIRFSFDATSLVASASVE